MFCKWSQIVSRFDQLLVPSIKQYFTQRISWAMHFLKFSSLYELYSISISSVFQGCYESTLIVTCVWGGSVCLWSFQNVDNFYWLAFLIGVIGQWGMLQNINWISYFSLAWFRWLHWQPVRWNERGLFAQCKESNWYAGYWCNPFEVDSFFRL